MDVTAPSQRTIERFTVNQRLQHLLLVASFTTLMVSGMPLRYPNSGLARALISSPFSLEVRGLVHRAAAVSLIVLGLYHVGYVLFTERGHQEFLKIMPRFKDLLDPVYMLLYYVGLRSEPPAFGRFSFIEKFEYFAVGWGSVIMVMTGFVLWFPEKAMLLLPKWAVDIAHAIHSYEALLAFLAIIIWHFYHVHLNPSAFPMSKVWLDGKITLEELRAHHPLEYEELVRRGEIVEAE